jgi:hypothetical protein
MTLPALVAQCRPFLGDDELHALQEPEAAATGPGEAGSVARQWLDGERQLRNAVARKRATGWGVAVEPYLRDHTGFRVDIEDGVIRAFDAPNPLDRERALDELRWRLLDDLAGVVPWGFAALFAYARRLHLVDERAGRDTEEGRRVLRTTLEALEHRYDAGIAPEVHDA